MYSTEEWLIGGMMILIAVFAFICSVVTILLIIHMRLFNGYTTLILSLTVCQVFYDLSFFLVPLYGNYYAVRITTLFSTFGAISASLWSNVISLVIHYVVVNLQSFDILRHYRMMALGITIPSFVFAMCATYFDETSNEYCIRITDFAVRCWSIAFNLVLYIRITRKLNHMGGLTDPKDSRHDFFGPLYALVSRIKYYPLCQSIYLIGAIWYYYIFGFDGISNYDTLSRESYRESTALCLYAICNAFIGIGYFWIFLAMQSKLRTPSEFNCNLNRNSSSSRDKAVFLSDSQESLLDDQDADNDNNAFYESHLDTGGLLGMYGHNMNNSSSSSSSNIHAADPAIRNVVYEMWSEDELMAEIEDRKRQIQISLDCISRGPLSI